MQDGIIAEAKTIEWVLVRGARLFRALQGKGVVGIARRRASLEFARTIHVALGRPLRALPDDEGNPYAQRLFTERLNEFCSAARLLMCQLVELDENQVHCCVKVFVKDPPHGDSVETYARSEPYDGRPITDDLAHPIDANTIWSALEGRSDGHFKWHPPFNTFCCNDLTKHPSDFRCTRPEWQSFYRAALVYPLRSHSRSDEGIFNTYGFLVFDTPKTGAFAGCPDIFEHKANRGVYHDLLNGNAIYHFGAFAADYLGIALRPYYRQQELKEVENVSTPSKPNLLA